MRKRKLKALPVGIRGMVEDDLTRLQAIENSAPGPFNGPVPIDQFFTGGDSRHTQRRSAVMCVGPEIYGYLLAYRSTANWEVVNSGIRPDHECEFTRLVQWLKDRVDRHVTCNQIIWWTHQQDLLRHLALAHAGMQCEGGERGLYKFKWQGTIDPPRNRVREYYETNWRWQ